MQFIVPDILTDARGLSPGTAVLLLLMGLMLWAYGWAWHRFWVVFGITMAAGVIGMTTSRSAGGQQVLVAGVLMAVAAGMVALEAAKLLAFATGGVVAWVAFQTLFPHAQELWAAFLSGGLIGVVLFRLWTMLVTSAVGSLVAGHAGMVLAAELGKLDSVGWAGHHAVALNGAVVATSLAGVILQAKLARSDEAKPGDDIHADHDDHGGKQKNPKKKTAAHDKAEHHGHHDQGHGKADGHGGHHDHGNDHGHAAKPAGRAGWKRFLPVPKLS